VPTGAPFIQPGRTGVKLQRFGAEACLEAVAACHGLDRDRVAATADRQFDTARIVDTVLTALSRLAVCRYAAATHMATCELSITVGAIHRRPGSLASRR
jgi:hypothetical protein